MRLKKSHFVGHMLLTTVCVRIVKVIQKECVATKKSYVQYDENYNLPGIVLLPAHTLHDCHKSH